MVSCHSWLRLVLFVVIFCCHLLLSSFVVILFCCHPCCWVCSLLFEFIIVSAVVSWLSLCGVALSVPLCLLLIARHIFAVLCLGVQTHRHRTLSVRVARAIPTWDRRHPKRRVTLRQLKPKQVQRLRPKHAHATFATRHGKEKRATRSFKEIVLHHLNSEPTLTSSLTKYDDHQKKS
jgi:hypothetical protein